MKRQAISYGIGAIAKDMVYALVSGFILYYYNTVLGISATFTGIMMMAARVFDAFNDPFMGVIVEKTHTKYGKFRPWIFSGTLLNALVLYGMFAMPNLNQPMNLVYASVFYVLWGVTYTMMDIPFWAMIPSLTDSGKERENISVVGRTCASIGFAIPTILTMLVVTKIGANEREGFRLFALIIAVLFATMETICVCGIKEKEVTNTKSASVKEMFQALFDNDQAMVVVVGIILFNASLYLTTQLALYFFKYDIGDSSLYSLFGTIGGVGQILSMMSLPALRKKWSSKNILTGGIGITILGYLLLFLLGMIGSRNIVLLGLSAFIIYIGFGLTTVLTTVFLADSVDYGEYKSGHRNESVIFSMQTFVVKLASAISVLIAGIGIDLIGLNQDALVQSDSTLFGLRFMMTIIPIVGLIVSVLYIRKKYILSEEKNAEIAEYLRNKHDHNQG